MYAPVMRSSDQPALIPSQTAALAALAAAGRPLTAYEVLEAVRRARPTAAAPTAYRALARLVALGLAHRIESLNAWVACSAEHDGAPAFSICDDCGTVDELADPGLASSVARLAEAGGFAPTRPVIELHGRCAGCQRA
jgi:Fur family zinc uptake transcriptional regulator